MPSDERDLRPGPPREPDPELLDRLEKQETCVPPVLAVRDRDLIRLLAMAGAGGSY